MLLFSKNNAIMRIIKNEFFFNKNLHIYCELPKTYEIYPVFFNN